jgi:MFS transporter, NNP family, nitrate/nitrite transporter
MKKKSVEGEHRRLDAVRQKHLTEPFWLQLEPVVFLTVLFLINFMARIILSPLLPAIERELGISHGEAGSFFFLISAGYVIALLD